MLRRLVVPFVGLLYVLGVIYASLSLLRPPKPPALPKARVVHEALTKHLLFVIVDGLRYDIATDPARMPRFAQAMERHRSADILAGPVSMTSSAIISFATGQRGRLEQIVRNINPDPPPFQSWMQNAREGGLKVALVGDPTWSEMFGRHFSELRLDPPGVAIDYDFNEQTFRNARDVVAHAPDALVLHFVTPDHQGHAYGIQTARYSKHISNFDRLLFDFLAELGPEWTIIVTSDHGANDAGDHGGDVLVHRRSPIFAYGPGIAPPGKENPQLDQVDVAGTLSALLGVPAPSHSQGHLLVNWLAVPAGERAKIACNDVERALTFARVLDSDRASELTRELDSARARLAGDPVALVAEARRLGEASDQLMRSQQGIFSARAWWLLGAVSLAAALVTWLLLGRIAPSSAGLSVLVALISIALTATVERLPGNGPKLSAGILFGVFNLPTLLLLFSSERFVALLNRCRSYAPALVPGIIAVTYPRNLQPEGCALILVVPLVILAAGSLERWGISGLTRERRGRWLDITLLIIWWLSLFPAAWFPEGLPGLALSRHFTAIFAIATALLGSVGLELVRRVPRASREIAWLTAAVVVALLLRRWAPPDLGRPALLLLPLLAIWPLRRGRVELALLCLLAGYMWVSRDMEVLSVAAATGLASLVGRRCAGLIHDDARRFTALTFWFTLAFVLRLGVNGGIDLAHLDFAAGAFADPAVSARWIGFCLIWKNLLALTIVGLAFLSAFPAQAAAQLARGFAVISACRVAVLLAMMQFARGSFWTSMRVVGDLPFTTIFFVSAGTVWLAYRQISVESNGESTAPRSEVTHDSPPLSPAPGHVREA